MGVGHDNAHLPGVSGGGIRPGRQESLGKLRLPDVAGESPLPASQTRAPTPPSDGKGGPASTQSQLPQAQGLIFRGPGPRWITAQPALGPGPLPSCSPALAPGLPGASQSSTKPVLSAAPGCHRNRKPLRFAALVMRAPPLPAKFQVGTAPCGGRK